MVQAVNGHTAYPTSVVVLLCVKYDFVRFIKLETYSAFFSMVRKLTIPFMKQRDVRDCVSRGQISNNLIFLAY